MASYAELESLARSHDIAAIAGLSMQDLTLLAIDKDGEWAIGWTGDTLCGSLGGMLWGPWYTRELAEHALRLCLADMPQDARRPALIRRSGITYGTRWLEA
jgi:hypothetical protein